MMLKITCVGGPRSGHRVHDNGESVYRFHKQVPLSPYTEDAGNTFHTYEDRYIRIRLYFDGKHREIFVWEHDVYRDLFELFTSELVRTTEIRKEKALTL